MKRNNKVKIDFLEKMIKLIDVCFWLIKEKKIKYSYLILGMKGIRNIMKILKIK